MKALWVRAVNNKAVLLAWIVCLVTITAKCACHANPVQLESLLDIDCSAYRWQDGSWIVLRQNAITRDGVVARVVIPTDNPQTARLSDGTSLTRRLDFFCARFKK